MSGTYIRNIEYYWRLSGAGQPSGAGKPSGDKIFGQKPTGKCPALPASGAPDKILLKNYWRLSGEYLHGSGSVHGANPDMDRILNPRFSI